jgi:hypothetical protein
MKRLLLVALFLIGCANSGASTPGEVIEKVYSPPASGTGYGFGTCTGSAGGTVVVGTCSGVVFWSSPERWTLIVRGDDGEVRAFAVSANDWADAEIGGRYEPKSTDVSVPSPTP